MWLVSELSAGPSAVGLSFHISTLYLLNNSLIGLIAGSLSHLLLFFKLAWAIPSDRWAGIGVL